MGALAMLRLYDHSFNNHDHDDDNGTCLGFSTCLNTRWTAKMSMSSRIRPIRTPPPIVRYLNMNAYTLWRLVLVNTMVQHIETPQLSLYRNLSLSCGSDPRGIAALSRESAMRRAGNSF